jgi:hypothetical protein
MVTYAAATSIPFFGALPVECVRFAASASSAVGFGESPGCGAAAVAEGGIRSLSKFFQEWIKSDQNTRPRLQ